MNARKIEALQETEFLVETNEGTFGQSEAVRKVGTADPAFTVRRVYETVGGRRRTVGPDEDTAPGATRYLNRRALAEARSRLADLQRQTGQRR